MFKLSCVIITALLSGSDFQLRYPNEIGLRVITFMNCSKYKIGSYVNDTERCLVSNDILNRHG